MNPKKQVYKVTTKGNLPKLEFLRGIPRGVSLQMTFSGEMEVSRVALGEGWKRTLPGFQIGIHTSEPIVSILKLITDEEIDQFQNFFDRCAQDYRRLATELITGLAKQLNVEINPALPLETLNPYGNTNYEQAGEYGLWRYFFHGFDCAFTHKKTGRYIEVPLTYGLEFGRLDPYFFSRFIESSPDYRPLPVAIYADYADGERIIDRMLKLGKFIRVKSNLKGNYGVTAKEGAITGVRVYEFSEDSAAGTTAVSPEKTPWQRIRLWLSKT